MCVKFFLLSASTIASASFAVVIVVVLDRKESLTSWKKLVHSFNLKCSFSRVVYTHFRRCRLGQEHSEQQPSTRILRKLFFTRKRNSCEKAAKLLCYYNGCNMLRLRVFSGGMGNSRAGCSFMLSVELKPFQLHSVEAHQAKRN